MESAMLGIRERNYFRPRTSAARIVLIGCRVASATVPNGNNWEHDLMQANIEFNAGRRCDAPCGGNSSARQWIGQRCQRLSPARGFSASEGDLIWIEFNARVL